jgi:hypothetical protein
MKKILTLCIIFAFVLLFFTSAYAHQLQEGHYVSNGGWDELLIKDGEALGTGIKVFDIEVVGVNAHRCSLSGKILPTGAVQVDDDEAGTCIIQFKPDETGIEIVGEESGTSCRNFCGSRAYFTGYYNRIKNICKPAEVFSAILAYEDSYKADEMKVVHEHIEPILQTCSKTIRREDEAKLREMMALANYHAGNKAGCRAALAPYKEILTNRKNEDFSHAPSDNFTWRAIAKRIRDTSDLCGE